MAKSKVTKIKGASVRKTTRKKSRIIPGTDTKIVLPTSPIEPSDDITDYTIGLYGEKGIGKTSLCAQFPDCYVTMWEPLRRNLRIRQIPKGPEEPPLDWERFKQYVDLFLQKNVSSVAIDTIDKCYEACFDYICRNKGIRHPKEISDDWGATWAEIKTEFEETINALRTVGTTVILVSHDRLREVTPRIGDKFDKIIPTCTPTAFNFMRAACDIIIYYSYYHTERALTVRGGELISCSPGVDRRFYDPDGNPLTTFPAGESPEEAYENLVKAFNGEMYSFAEEYEEKT